MLVLLQFLAVCISQGAFEHALITLPYDDVEGVTSGPTRACTSSLVGSDGATRWHKHPKREVNSPDKGLSAATIFSAISWKVKVIDALCNAEAPPPNDMATNREIATGPPPVHRPLPPGLCSTAPQGYRLQ